MIRWLKAGGAGILAAGVCLGGAAWSDARELAGRRAELQREARLIARLVAARMQGGLERHLTAMRQMANFYATSRRVGEKQFHSYAANTLKMNPACLNIAYVDPALRIQRSYPPEAVRWRPVFDARSHPPGYEAVIRADRALKPMLSPPKTNGKFFATAGWRARTVSSPRSTISGSKARPKRPSARLEFASMN